MSSGGVGSDRSKGKKWSSRKQQNHVNTSLLMKLGFHSPPEAAVRAVDRRIRQSV